MVEVVESNSDVVAKRRRKIWQIESCYHCSVIGACLNRGDLKRIAAKSVFNFTADATAFSVHQRLSSISSIRSDKARALQKILDGKHRLAIKKYAGCNDENEIEQQWKSDVASKKGIAGAYWAIMTHPLCQNEILSQVYGESHMLSYDIFAGYQSDEKKFSRLVRQNNLAIARSEKTAVAQKRKISLLQEKITDLKKDSGRHRRDRLLCDKLKKENDRLKEKLTELSDKAGSDADNLLIALKSENGALLEEIKNSNESVAATGDLLKNLRQAYQFQEERLMTIEQEKLEVQEELNSLEAMFTLAGQFDVDTAMLLTSHMSKSYTGKGNIFIHTAAITEVSPQSKKMFNSMLGGFNLPSTKIYLMGEKGHEICHENGKVIVKKERPAGHKSCGRCKNCKCGTSKVH